MPVTVEYPSITRDDILDGMVTALASVTAGSGDAVDDTRFLYSVGRYMGELRSEEAFKRGVAGRTPAVRVAFVSDRSMRTTIGRRVDYVEGTFACVVFADTSKGKDARQTVLSAAERVQRLLSSRALGLKIKPLRHRSTSEIPAIENCTAYNVTFSTKYRVDYTKDPGADVIESASGEIVNNEVTRSPKPHAPTLSVQGTEGTSTVSYALVGLDADGLPTLLGDVATVTDAPGTLNGTDFVRVTWSAIDGIETYQVIRTASDASPSTTGVIAETALLTFDDTGIAPSADVPIDAVYAPVALEFEE